MKGKITLIQILLICVLVICSYLVVDNLIKKERDKVGFEKIKNEVATISPVTSDEPLTEEIKQQRLNVYKDLYERNNDTVGWIRILGTQIDYPVLHNTQSNAYYLHRNFEREYSSSGIPFLDYQCKSDATSDNTIIYAHNMRNGTMFHDLLKYADKSFYDTHKTVEFDTLTDLGTYEVFAVIRTKVGSKNEFKYYDFVEADSPAEFDSFVSECISNSLYKTNIIPQYGDKLLTLSTCSYNTDNERFVVFAKKIK